MVRVDERRWVKAGIELSDGRAMLSSVLTDGKSDWATGPYEHDAQDLWMRATVVKGVLRLQVSADGKTWPLVRLAPFPITSAYQVGPMACTPERAGLEVHFSDLSITAPVGQGPPRPELIAMTQKERMLAGQLYVADDPELVADAVRCRVARPL